jgi:PKD repeat protein
LTATSDDDGAKATMWTVALAPSGPPPVNQPPIAAFTSSCTFLDCSFDAAPSSDPDGTVTAWDWDFGDGTTGTGDTPNHTYPTAATYTVELTVTDNDGATHTTTNTITTTDPPASTPIEFRGLTEFSGNVSVVDTSIPGATQTGDALLLFVTMNGSNQTITPPAGWTELAVQTDQSMETRVYLRVAQPGDAGSDVTLSLSAWRKTVVIIAAYGGVDSGDPIGAVASAPETANTASHVTPTASAAVDGSLVLSYWADKTSSTTSWNAPADVTERAMVATSGGGRITALYGDTGPVPAGSYGGLTATASSNGGKATMFTIILEPAP